jgi:hypothetical protein
MAYSTINTNLEPPPFRIPIYDDLGVMNTVWVRWFQGIWDRSGSASGDSVYDAIKAAAITSATEPQLYGIQAAIQAEITGLLLSVIEQLQAQTFDFSSLLGDVIYPPPALQEIPDVNVAGILQQSRDVSPVQSVFGRTGDVIATEGDYTLTQLADVTITSVTATNVLQYNGSAWVNSVSPGSAYYETLVATAGQTVFNTTVPTQANAGGRSYLMITRNGIVLDEGITNDYTVTGANQITFVVASVISDKITIRGWS